MYLHTFRATSNSLTLYFHQVIMWCILVYVVSIIMSTVAILVTNAIVKKHLFFAMYFLMHVHCT